MFTGFASENTPAIQVWDFARTYASGTAARSISLADDCSPIQFFRTGASSTAIKVYLPTCPIEGKQITIVNARYNSTAQSLAIYSSDTSGTGSDNLLYVLGFGGSLVLTYSKNFIGLGPSSFGISSGWLSLNQSPVSADNAYSVLVGGNQNVANGTAATVIGGQINTNNSSYGSIVGGANNTAANTYSSVVGGLFNYANANSASVVGGSYNTASGQGAAIVGGSTNTANQAYAATLGGEGSSASSVYAVVLGSFGGTASGSYSAVLSGVVNTASGDSSTVIGGRYGTTRSINGSSASSLCVSPIIATAGVSQAAAVVLARQTTDATATVLASNSFAGSTTNQVILPNNSAYYFRGSITAGVTGAGNSSMWSFEGGIKRGAGVGTTVLVGTPVVNLVAQDSGASTWTVALAADTTNGGLKVTVTGQAATTIRWVCKVETTEMTF